MLRGSLQGAGTAWEGSGSLPRGPSWEASDIGPKIKDFTGALQAQLNAD